MTFKDDDFDAGMDVARDLVHALCQGVVGLDGEKRQIKALLSNKKRLSAVCQVVVGLAEAMERPACDVIFDYSVAPGIRIRVLDVKKPGDDMLLEVATKDPVSSVRKVATSHIRDQHKLLQAILAPHGDGHLQYIDELRHLTIPALLVRVCLEHSHVPVTDAACDRLIEIGDQSAMANVLIREDRVDRGRLDHWFPLIEALHDPEQQIRAFLGIQILSLRMNLVQVMSQHNLARALVKWDPLETGDRRMPDHMQKVHQALGKCLGHERQAALQWYVAMYSKHVCIFELAYRAYLRLMCQPVTSRDVVSGQTLMDWRRAQPRTNPHGSIIQE